MARRKKNVLEEIVDKIVEVKEPKAELKRGVTIQESGLSKESQKVTDPN